MVSKEEMSWFHCGKCGALFMSPVGDQENRVCTECGRSPVVSHARNENGEPAAQVYLTPVTSERRGKRVKGRSRQSLIFKIIFGWLLFIGLIILMGRFLWPSAAPQVAAASAAAGERELSDQQFVQANAQLLGEAFQNFLTAPTPEAKTQYVHDPIRMAGRMARFYQYDSSSVPDLNALKSSGYGVLHLPEGDVIETRWTHEDGRIYQALFRQEEGEWRLDWEDFVRYSDCPWASFLIENTDGEGEFRLLARERVSRSESNPASTNLVFYAPRLGYPEEIGTASPHFAIERDSENGKILAKAFEQRGKDIALFNSSLPDLDPVGIIRLRAKIRRVAGASEPTFVLEKVLACHWMDTTASGFSQEQGHSDSTDKR